MEKARSLLDPMLKDRTALGALINAGMTLDEIAAQRDVLAFTVDGAHVHTGHRGTRIGRRMTGQRLTRSLPCSTAGNPVILFHSTTPEAAETIIREGFRGASGSYGFVGHRFEDVVFLSVEPCDVNEGAKGDTVLRIDVGGMDLSDYAIEERGRVWEYAIPVDVLTRLPSGAVIHDGS